MSSLETRRTLDEDVLDISQMLSEPGHEASAASNAMPGSRENVRAPRLLARNRAALPQAGRRPPREAKGCADGAMVLSQDEIDGSAPASSALRRRLEC